VEDSIICTISWNIIMEFSIDIHTALTGEIIVEDFSKEYG